MRITEASLPTRPPESKDHELTQIQVLHQLATTDAIPGSEMCGWHALKNLIAWIEQKPEHYTDHAHFVRFYYDWEHLEASNSLGSLSHPVARQIAQQLGHEQIVVLPVYPDEPTPYVCGGGAQTLLPEMMKFLPTRKGEFSIPMMVGIQSMNRSERHWVALVWSQDQDGNQSWTGMDSLYPDGHFLREVINHLQKLIENAQQVLQAKLDEHFAEV